jgi:hypothetical protein
MPQPLVKKPLEGTEPIIPEPTKTRQPCLGRVLKAPNITANQKIALDNHVAFVLQPACFALDFSE